MAATDPVTQEPRRFSIRLPRPLWIGLATVVLVVVAVGRWFGVPIYRQQVVIGEIDLLGGDIFANPRGPEWFRDLIGDRRMTLFEDVIEAQLLLTPTTDATLDQISQLTRMQNLYLGHTQVTDAGLAHLQKLTNLEILDLDDTAVTDAGLQHLTGLTKLKWLSVRHTQVTDVGIADLQRALPRLAIGSSTHIHP